MANKDQIQVCRDRCEPAMTDQSKPYLLCFSECMNEPMVELVRKHHGDAAADTCNNFFHKREQSLYRLEPSFVATAESNAAKATDIVGNRTNALAYWKMPKAPWPTKNSDGTLRKPIGIRDSRPYWPGYVKFLKGDGRTCFKYDLLARAYETVGKPEKVLPQQAEAPVNRNWRFYVGAGALALSMLYFAKGRR